MDVFSWLESAKDILNVSLTCKRFKLLTEQEWIWELAYTTKFGLDYWGEGIPPLDIHTTYLKNLLQVFYLSFKCLSIQITLSYMLNSILLYRLL